MCFVCVYKIKCSVHYKYIFINRESQVESAGLIRRELSNSLVLKRIIIVKWLTAARWAVKTGSKYSENLTLFARWENIATDAPSVSLIPGLPRHVVKEKHIIRGSDPSFRPATTRRKGSSSSREKTEGGGMGEGNEERYGYEQQRRIHIQGRQWGGSVWCAGQEAAWEVVDRKRKKEREREGRRNDCGTRRRWQRVEETERANCERDPPALRVVIIINLSGV